MSATEKELEELRTELAEARETLRAIRDGRVDALVVCGPRGHEVYTLTSADRAFRELAERMSEGAATIASDGTILWANRQLAALVGRPSERLLGTSVAEVLAPGASPLADPMDCTRSMEVDLHRPDGSVVPVRLSFSRVTIGGIDAWALIASDLTAARQTEAILRQSASDLERRVAERTEELAASRRELEAAEDRVRRLIEAVAAQLPVGVIVAEPDGWIVYRNDEAVRIWKRATADESLPERIGPPRERSAAPIEGPLAYALAGEHVPDAEITIGPAGHPLTALVRADPVRDERGVAIAAVCAIVDITDRREAQALHDAFVDVMAHELKTPLTTIYGAVQTLVAREGLPPETRKELIEDAASETQRLVHLVDDMLVLSRVERGGSFVLDEPLMVEHVVRAVVGARGAQRQQLVHVRVVNPPLPVVRGERVYAEQIVNNLLRNAEKYGAPPIEIVLERVEDGVAVRVLDSGPGFESDPELLFDLFFREQFAKSRASGGGIGLFVCRELARMMGGRVWAKHRPEGGAEFGFVLPLYEESAPGQD